MLSILGAKSGTAKAFRKALASAKDGEVILLARTKEVPSGIEVHPDGVAFSKGNKVLLNGTHCLYQGEAEEWASHVGGIVIRRGYELLLNGEKRLYEGHFDDWHPHPLGVIIERDNKLLLNGTQVLYEGPFDGFFDWYGNPSFPAFLVEDAEGFLLGGKFRLTVPEDATNDGGGQLHPDGIACLVDEEIRLPSGVTFEVENLVAWGVHRHGIVVCVKPGELYQFRLIVHKTFDADEVIV